MNIPISPLQIRHDAAVPLPGEVPRVRPWEKAPPSKLYKYYPPERLHVLTDCMVRFSQREVFDDQADLRPEVANFGSAEEIRAFMNIDPVLAQYSTELKEAVIAHVLQTPGREQELIRQTQRWMTAPEEFGVFCLCRNNLSRQMWNQYAADGRGFVAEFNTLHTAFTLLKKPGLIGEVEYSDHPISSFLSRYGASAFFRKRSRYQFEAEWRSVRALTRFKTVLRPSGGPPIYLAPFDPGCVSKMLILSKSSVEWELRTLAAVDARYRHVPVVVIEDTQLRRP
jgi:hypothetical protein